jgi:hypothetical protein
MRCEVLMPVRMVTICQTVCHHTLEDQILMTLSTAVPWMIGDKTTDWVGLRACLNIEREKDPWLYRN